MPPGPKLITPPFFAPPPAWRGTPADPALPVSVCLWRPSACWARDTASSSPRPRRAAGAALWERSSMVISSNSPSWKRDAKGPAAAPPPSPPASCLASVFAFPLAACDVGCDAGLPPIIHPASLPLLLLLPPPSAFPLRTVGAVAGGERGAAPPLTTRLAASADAACCRPGDACAATAAPRCGV